jgi:hypothetical protein
VQSAAKEGYGKFVVTAGKFFADSKKSRGLQTSEDAKFYSISSPLTTPFENKGKDLVIQFTAKFEQNIGKKKERKGFTFSHISFLFRLRWWVCEAYAENGPQKV